MEGGADSDTFRLTFSEGKNVIVDNCNFAGFAFNPSINFRYTNSINGSSDFLDGTMNLTAFTTYQNIPGDGEYVSRRKVVAARYRSNTDGDYDDFNFTVTKNSGYNADPHLSVVQHGSDTEVPHSMYTLRDGGGEQVTSFSSSVGDVSNTDRATVLATLNNAINSNNETPINYSSAVSGNTVTLTAAEVGASEGNWVLTVNHGGVTGTNAGNMTSTHANVTVGRDEQTASVAYTLTDPLTDTEYVTTLTGNLSASQIADALADFTVPNWTLANSGATVTFTSDSEAPIGSLWTYADVETNNNQSVAGAIVETTNGVRPVPGTTFTMVDAGTGQTLLSGTIPGASRALDNAGAYIAAAPALEGDLGFLSANDRLTFTYNDFGQKNRPALTINNPTPGTGTLAAANNGADTHGSSVDDVAQSEYTITLPTGFAPATLTVESRNESRSEVLFKIRDAINQTTFTPVNISAAVVSNQLFISWSDYTIASDARIAIDSDNMGGTGNISFAAAVETVTNQRSLELHAADRGNTFNGEIFTSYVERKNLNMGDLEATKWNRVIYPLMSGTGNVDVFVKGSGKAGALVTLDADNADRKVFDIDEDYKLEPRQNGRFVNIRFQSDDDANWTLDGYSLNVETEDYR